MNIQATAVSLALAVGLWSTAVQAQSLSRGVISGTITTASVIVPSGGAPTVVFITPAPGSKQGVFILTQVCSEKGKDLALSGDTMGPIPVLEVAECTTFVPGVAVPPGETLTFMDTGGTTQPALITGVLSKK